LNLDKLKHPRQAVYLYDDPTVVADMLDAIRRHQPFDLIWGGRKIKKKKEKKKKRKNKVSNKPVVLPSSEMMTTLTSFSM
jgi:hypothetical protein